MRLSWFLVVGLALAGCNKGSAETADSGLSLNSDGDDGTGGTGGLDGPAPLAEPSGGCPDLSSGGVGSIDSSGQDRAFNLILPDPMPAEPGLMFWFHGVANVGYDAITLEAQGLQGLADAYGTIMVVPEAPVFSIDIAGFGVEFLFWDFQTETDADLVLYDDLRTCIAREHNVDLARVGASGFSGGAMFTTTLAAERGDTLAAVAQGSGGADIVIDVDENIFGFDIQVSLAGSTWREQANKFPMLIGSGGETDVWPSVEDFGLPSSVGDLLDGVLPLVRFNETTDTLEGHLTDQGHFTVRCDHDLGHTMTSAQYGLVIEWASTHRFGEPSPYADGSGLPSGCTVRE